MSGGRIKYRYQIPYKNVYRVGETVGNQQETRYATIQAAINAAVADGYTDNNNPALVEIYSKSSGAYVENLVLNAGVSLRGMDAKAVAIQGNHTWAPVGGNAATNRIFIENINMFGVALAPTFTFGGTAAARLFLRQSSINREGLDDGLGCFVLSNTNNSARVQMNDTSIYHLANAGGGYAFDMQRGRLNMSGNCDIYCEGAGGVIPFALNNNANINARGGAYFTDTFVAESGSTIFEINSASVFLNLVYFTCNNLGGGSIFTFNAAGTVVAATCALNTSGPDIADGAGGGTLLTVMPVTQSGDAAGSSYGNDYGRNAVPSNLGLITIPTKNRYENTYSGNVGYVGFQWGYPTIQAAINDLFARAGGGAFTVVLAKGVTFTENVTLLDGTILEGEDNTDISVNQFAISQINGTVSYNAGGGPGITMKNIKVQAPIGGRAFQYSDGGNYGSMNFQNCRFDKNDTDGVDCTMNFDGSGGGGGGAYFVDSYVTRQNENVSAAILTDSMSFVYLYASYLSVSGAGILPNCPLFRITNGTVTSEYCIMDASSKKCVVLEDAGATFSAKHSTFEFATEEGEGFTYSGAGYVDLQFCRVNISNIEPGTVLARDGTQATGNFAFSGNAYAPGDGIEINGVNFINGVDFVVAGTTALTVANIAAAINASINPLIQDVVYANANGTTLEIYSWKYVAAANAITISVVGTAPALASGATLTGGANGAGGQFNYTASFGLTRIQNTITTFQYPTAVTPF